ncbi:MAG: hypothetical protein HUK24_07070, partial [Sphaerochaetaceae bacterium]|nr:hypothetical protein [Sphaerochaetaceae bacterium]
EERKNDFPLNFVLVGVSNSKVTITNSEGLEIPKIIKAKENGTLDSSYLGKKSLSILEGRPQILVNCLPSNLETKGQVSSALILEALENGINIVDLDKSALVFHWKEIFQKAKEKNLIVRYGGAANAGLHTLETGAFLGRTGELAEFGGIFNRTCHFVMKKMEEGLSYIDAVKLALEEGIAEKNYILDTEGFDVAQKLVIQANTYGNKVYSLDDVKRTGLSQMNPETLISPQGKIWRYVGRANLETNTLTVGPELLSKDSFLGSCLWTDKAVQFVTKTQGLQNIKSSNAPGNPTIGTALMDMVQIGLSL